MMKPHNLHKCIHHFKTRVIHYQSLRHIYKVKTHKIFHKLRDLLSLRDLLQFKMIGFTLLSHLQQNIIDSTRTTLMSNSPKAKWWVLIYSWGWAKLRGNKIQKGLKHREMQLISKLMSLLKFLISRKTLLRDQTSIRTLWIILKKPRKKRKIYKLSLLLTMRVRICSLAPIKIHVMLRWLLIILVAVKIYIRSLT